MTASDPYIDFTVRFKLLAGKYSDLGTMTLSKISTIRPIGNKNNDGPAEIAIEGTPAHWKRSKRTS
jgi:hypothetical protein